MSDREARIQAAIKKAQEEGRGINVPLPSDKPPPKINTKQRHKGRGTGAFLVAKAFRPGHGRIS